MQNWQRLYGYIHEYQNLVYDYYAKIGVAFLVTYWNINKDKTVWDDDQILGGSYERTGSLTGIKFDKYLLLPVYFTDEINTGFDATETGQNKEQETTIVFPSVYGITPYPGDIVKLEQAFMRPTNNVYPLFIVTGVEIHPNTDRRFWKLKIKVYQSKVISDVDDQVEDVFVFFDYDKKIHTLDEATILAKMLDKNEELRGRLKGMWDENSGFFNL